VWFQESREHPEKVHFGQVIDEVTVEAATRLLASGAFSIVTNWPQRNSHQVEKNGQYCSPHHCA
jgi:hypothetical protein